MKAMRVAVLYLATGLTGGFALSALLNDDTNRSSVTVAPDSAPLQRRVARLESQLDTVISANAALRAEVEQLNSAFSAAIPALQPEIYERMAGALNGPFATEPQGEQQSGTRDVFRPARLRGAERNLAARLTEAGFTPADAQHIETRIEELRVAAMQSRYEALRSGAPQAAIDRFRDSSAALRTELGDADYERFLEATGRSTRVGVTSVLATSPAQAAGMQPGDQILAYAGQRVFDVRELNQVLLEGEPGEPVVVDIERDGQPIQLVIPRGPLGIAADFTRRGGR